MNSVKAVLNKNDKTAFVINKVEIARLVLPQQQSQHAMTELQALECVSQLVSSVPYHKGLLPCADVILSGSHINLLYKFIKQGSICEYMKRHRVPYLSEMELMACTHTIADALNTLHKARFAHGNVRPEHILI